MNHKICVYVFKGETLSSLIQRVFLFQTYFILQLIFVLGVDKEFVLGLYPLTDYLKNVDEGQQACSFDLNTQNFDEESKLVCEGSFKEPLSQLPIKSVSVQ